MSVSLAHIINTVTVGKESDLFLAQPITFETMRRARAFAQALDVELYTTQFVEDRVALDGFRATPDLERSVLDFGEFAVRRKLPLIGDVLARLYAASGADVFIYTNVDIALKREFYVAVAALMDGARGRGLDAAVINRRTVHATVEQASDLEWLYRQPGDKHPGWDCFVFRRALLQGFDFHALCIGAVPVGQALLAALSTLAERCELYEDEALTFHVNDDRVWQSPANQPFQAHNFREAQKIVDALEARRPLSRYAEQLKRRLREEPAL
jgi:hypothetical protein